MEGGLREIGERESIVTCWIREYDGHLVRESTHKWMISFDCVIDGKKREKKGGNENHLTGGGCFLFPLSVG
jgi:hypothetical protein